PGKIVVVQGVLGQGFSEQLDQGLDEALEGSGFEVVVREQGFFDRTTAIDVVSTAYQAHPDLSGIVSYSASMSNGIAQWLQDNDKEGVVHVGSDCDDELVEWLKTPYLEASRYYSSAQTGLIGGTAVLAALQGSDVPFETPVEQVIATADNIDDIIAENPYTFESFRDQVQDI
ncbi:substrate-binding domain-containing protein, partial [Ilumatobacter sp.]|uniref:substrate-binding domain-containing protein n=1 Tax=Ilumatobacter sp. TaxID=1967498 RepID=UPI003C56300E